MQAEFLHELQNAACDHDDPQDNYVRHFLKALEAAIRWEFPVHVSLAPLGHTDLGWYTVFPHCPRCKSNAPVGRWKESYPNERHECRACGHTFNPNEHHSSERDEYDWNADSLEKRLGEAGHDEFVRAFLLHRGCSPEQVEEVMDNKNTGPLLRRIKAVRQQRDATLRRLTGQTILESEEAHPATMSIALGDDLRLSTGGTGNGYSARTSWRIGTKPVWLSTAGAGVSWLHVRLDDRPKYYGYRPYREPPRG